MTTQTPPLTGQDINLAARAVRDLLDVLLERAGISFEQSLALQALGPAPGGLDRAALVADLATRLRVAPAAIAELLDGLVEAGLVVDEPPNARLTSNGQAVYKGVQAGIARVVRDLYGEFAPDELATTRRVLRDITERAERLHAVL